ncbi:hypothetical protein BC832DRAFT_559786 [Gaertneriomyces semiglobifer]|nr:hypothetical protein BC832DRAFT_559786 [Gaertneriomyces semiglobifer]
MYLVIPIQILNTTNVRLCNKSPKLPPVSHKSRLITPGATRNVHNFIMRHRHLAELSLVRTRA